MRKLFALLLVLCLMPFAAMAEMVEYDFGDFTMTIPADIPGNIGEKASNQVWFTLYPEYDENQQFHPNLNCVWGNGYEDLSKYVPAELGQTILNGMVQNLKSQGIAISNAEVIMGEIGAIDGEYCISIGYTYDADYTNAGINLQVTNYLIQFMVSNPEKGTFTFSYTTNDINTAQVASDILASIKWN